MFRRILFTLLLCFLPFASMAQQDDTCPEIVRSALDLVNDVCGNTSRNQACYGNLTLVAEPQPDVQSLKFDQPGDIVDLSDVHVLYLSGMDEDVPEWGVSMIKLQANLPETLPGQNVMFLLFGDVEIRNAVDELPQIEVTVVASGSVNVRGGPSTGDEVVASLASGTTVTANGRNESGDWIRIVLPDSGSGWVADFLVQSDTGLSELNVVQAGQLAFTPMQAFYLSTGVGDANCNEAPDSGVLVQTPDGVGEINFTVNGVDVTLGSTAYLQSEAGTAMTISVIAGQGTVTAQDKTVIVPAGTRTRVPIDAKLVVTDVPSDAEPYDMGDLRALPVNLLPRQIEIHEPLSHVVVTYTQTIDDAYCPATIKAGNPIILSVGSGYHNAGEAIANSQQDFSHILIDGARVGPVTRHYDGLISNGLYNYRTDYVWGTPDPGTYTIHGVEQNMTHVCQITIAGN